MNLAELSRLVENLLRIGTIAEVDHPAARCRVQTGGLLTGWLPFMPHRAGNTRTWDPPTVGEQVLVLSPSGEPAGGLVLTGIYSDARSAPSQSPDDHVIDYPDGARIAYNHATGALTAIGIQTARIEAAVSVTLDTPYTHLTGQLEVDGLITYHNGMMGEAGDYGHAVTILGDLLHEQGILRSNGVVLHTHHHVGPDAGDPVPSGGSGW